MQATTFIPRPEPREVAPRKRPASPNLPSLAPSAPELRPVKHKTLPYGVPAVSWEEPGVAPIQIADERPAHTAGKPFDTQPFLFTVPVLAAAGMSAGAELAAVSPRQWRQATSLGIGVLVGFLAAYLLLLS